MRYYIIKQRSMLDGDEFLKAFTSKKECTRYVKRHRYMKNLAFYIVTEKLLWKSKGVKNV